MTPKGTQRASCSALVTPQAGGALPATALWPPRRPRPGLAWPGLRGTAGPTDTGTGAAPAPGQGKTGEERGEGRGGKRRPLRCHSRSAGGRPRAGAAAPWPPRPAGSPAPLGAPLPGDRPVTRRGGGAEPGALGPVRPGPVQPPGPGVPGLKGSARPDPLPPAPPPVPSVL